MTPTHCPKCGHDPDSIEEMHIGWYLCRHCKHYWRHEPCALECDLRANAMQRHTDAERAEAEAREEAATPMTETRRNV